MTANWITPDEWKSQSEGLQHLMRAAALAVEDAFRTRCFRLGEDYGPVCQFCDEPMTAVLDRRTSNTVTFTDNLLSIADWRVPVCAVHAAQMGAGPAVADSREDNQKGTRHDR